MKTRIKNILQEKPVGQPVSIAGWVRTKRDTGSFSFIEVNDGSCLANLQVIGDEKLDNYMSEIKQLSTGSSVMVDGELKKSPAKGQDVELHAIRFRVIGKADPETYPLQKKRHSFEFLREISHLRPRTNALGAVSRVDRGFPMRCISSFRIKDLYRYILQSSPPVTARVPVRCFR